VLLETQDLIHLLDTGDGERRIAEETIADVDASGLWPGEAVTEVSAAGPFWEAEPEHQDYLERYPQRTTRLANARRGR
jgi:peptide-methionine (S)-S-oxide reductase